MICVDASIGAKWIFPEEHSNEALALLSAAVESGERIVAPHLLPVEVTNVIRRRVEREGLSLRDGAALLTHFLNFPVTLRPMSSADRALLHHAALAVALNYNLPAVYDAHYVALADMLRCTLWTDDRRLLRALGGRLSYVRWIGDYH